MGTLLNRRRYMGGGSSLPYDTEVEYLQSVAGTKIDTGLYYQTGDVLIIDGYIPKSPYRLVLGGTQKTSCIAVGIGGHSNIGLFYYGNTETSISGANFTAMLGKHVYELDHRLKVDNNYIVTKSVQTFTTDDTVKILCSGAGYRVSNYKHIRNGVAIFDAIAVRAGQVGYLYDKVSRRLFGNAGTGDFVLGPDKT